MADLEASTELLRTFGDATRVRLLALLAKEELSVAELTEVVRVAQSRVSAHLGRLKDAGLVRDRKAGASSFYKLDDGAMTEEAKRVWAMLDASTTDPLLEQDRARLKEVVKSRNGGSSWADSVAGRMERHYSPGRTWEAALRGVLGIVRLGDVLDVASGDGALAELIAPRARSITCIDASEKVVEAARARLSAMPNVRLVLGDMHELPFKDDSFDQVMAMNCLTFTRTPKRLMSEVARVLRPGGDAVIVTLKSHKHEQVSRAFDHLRLGFSVKEVSALISGAGLEIDSAEVTSREKRPPNFEVITAAAHKRKGSKR